MVSMHKKSRSLFALLLLLALAILWFSISVTATTDDAPYVLVVNSDPTDPAVPLDLVLIVRLFAKERLLEITARVGKHPAYPAELFFDKDVKVQIQLPPGIELQKGKLSWQGDLRGDEIGEFQATVKAVRDLEAAVDAKASGHAEGRIDIDDERFYVFAKGRTMKIGLNPFTKVLP
jgi:hypothetical protein